MENNVKFARSAVDKVAEPAKFKESCKKGQEMVVNIEKRRFKKKETFERLQGDLKKYHNDLAESMNKIAMLATSTNTNLAKVINKIKER